MEKVVLGLSGGVDSAVSAALLREQGYEVYGLYLDNASEDARRDAEKTAEALGIPLRVEDISAELESLVCAPFAEAYLRGETPNPCILCNPALKFRRLIEEADRIGARYIATGHYARTENGALLRAKSDKDQSYLLCRITREQLSRLLLPLGEMADKAETRTLALQYGIPVADKPDSMEICFIPDKDYIGWLNRRGDVPAPGSFVFHGTEIGRHEGIHRWTVGQRIPGLYNERKLYVSALHPESREVELALWEELFSTTVFARDFHPLADLPDGPFRGCVKVRHTKWECPPCVVTPLGNCCVRIDCDEPVRAPAPGQSAVIYGGSDNQQVLASGIITAEQPY